MNSVGDDSLKMVEKRQKIQWDEVTIAEHDKERGTRYSLIKHTVCYNVLYFIGTGTYLLIVDRIHPPRSLLLTFHPSILQAEDRRGAHSVSIPQ